ncbi:SNF-related serine/threonine-protein kinase-like isoform X4 [Bolinopsis microptera]|uniref:SNF-related serine/threonine-protein kinase-like isoform X4 n=1 Tax=Bolinopsis microptera TaxID=2820187 RepID=UPI0030790A51
MESNIAGLYDLDKVLGKGHYGIVRLARHVFSGQMVAVKVIDKTKLDQRETDHLLKEVQCMKLVRHPNVVRLYHVITTKNKLYLVLELGSGGDLLDYLNKMPDGIGEERTREYFGQIIRAIAYCHHLHIVHRDLKPENIIFNEDYSVLKLTDFGFSNEFSPGEKLMTYCGSWKYSAPEILLQEEYDPPAVDVWSLGVMLFQMVAGRLPFSEVNQSETLTKIMDGSYEMPDEISDDLKDLLSRMIVVDPKDRITVDEVLAHPWCSKVKIGGPINGLVHEVGITPEEHEKVAKILSDNKIATRELLKKSIDANSYDYISATYLLLAEQLKQKRIKEVVHQMVPAVESISITDKRRGSMPEANVDLLNDIRTRRRDTVGGPLNSPRNKRENTPIPAMQSPSLLSCSNACISFFLELCETGKGRWRGRDIPESTRGETTADTTADTTTSTASPKTVTAVAPTPEVAAAPATTSSSSRRKQNKHHYRLGSLRTSVLMRRKRNTGPHLMQGLMERSFKHVASIALPVRDKDYKLLIRGSSCSGSEEEPSKSPTLGGDKFLRDEDTFFTGKMKASPKRTSRRTIASLNIHAIGSSSDDSEDEDTNSNGGIFDSVPRSKTLTRLFRRPTPPSGGLVNIEEEEGPADEVYLAASKSQPSTLKKKRHSPLTVSTSLESEEASDMVSPLATPLCVQRKKETGKDGSNHSSFSSSVELSSDDSELDLAKRKKLSGLSKRDRSAAKKSPSSNMLALVQEKLRHLEANYNLTEREPELTSPTSPSSVLPNIAEYTNEHTVKYIRHPVYWSIEDIERHTDNIESNGNARCDNAPEFQRLTSDDGLPIEMFGSVKSTICSVM